MDNRINQISITTTVGKQTQTREFGEVLKDSLRSGANALGTVTGLIAGTPALGMVSAAVSSVTSFASHAATGVTQVATANTAANTSIIDSGNPADSTGMVSQMRAETDRSIAMQMQMQQESRDYNTLSNVLKTRHDSAKAAINNIR